MRLRGSADLRFGPSALNLAYGENNDRYIESRIYTTQ